MPSDFGRGLRFGMGFAVGVSIILGFLLFGVSMCAGHFQRRMFEELKEQLEESIPPGQLPNGKKEDRIKGSPHIFHHPQASKMKEIYPRPLNLQRGKDSKAKAYQVRDMIDRARAMNLIK